MRTSDRDALQDHMTGAAIGTLIHYPIPPHMQAAYSGMGIALGALPLAHNLTSKVLSLSMRPQLGLDQLQDIVNALNNT